MGHRAGERKLPILASLTADRIAPAYIPSASAQRNILLRKPTFRFQDHRKKHFLRKILRGWNHRSVKVSCRFCNLYFTFWGFCFSPWRRSSCWTARWPSAVLLLLNPHCSQDDCFPVSVYKKHIFLLLSRLSCLNWPLFVSKNWILLCSLYCPTLSHSDQPSHITPVTCLHDLFNFNSTVKKNIKNCSLTQEATTTNNC